MSVLSSRELPPAPTKPDRYAAFAALRHRDFRLLWIGQIVSITGSQMQLVAINWHIYLLTKSALALGLVGLFRGVPIVLCSLVGGVLADALNRKRLLVVTQSVMLVCAAMLTIVTLLGLSNVWPIYLLTAAGSAAAAFDIPARQALMPSLVPAKDFPNAVSLGLIVFNVAMVLGPSLAGLVLAHQGPASVYAINSLSFLAVIAALLAMQTSGQVNGLHDENARVNLKALVEGLRFVWHTPIIVQTMTLDFAATFFAAANALLPIFAQEILNVGPKGLGFLTASPAVGSVATALVLARIGHFRSEGKLVILSVTIFGLATIGFGVSHLFWLSLLLLAVAGGADTISTVLRQTIRQFCTPDRLRGRMTSINMVFFMGGPQLGELEAGVVASFVGASWAVVSGGIGSVGAALIALFKAKHLANYRSPN